jgi:uncharacterized protein GlcG (DUF336 family)
VKNDLRWLPPLVIGSAMAVIACSNTGPFDNEPNVPTSGVELTQTDVDQILVNAVSEANAANTPAVVAVTDREGEVLGVFQMNVNAAPNGVGIVDSFTPLGFDFAGAAIAKAATAAAFQSSANAFTTRTAFFIVQGHFPPNVVNTAGGPLFGVQDSGQPSSDAHILAYDQSGNATGAGVVGLLGGVPLYKNGSPVGGIGVATIGMIDSQGNPSENTLTNGIQKDLDEVIARAGAQGFDAPTDIQATNIFVGGIGFPYFGLTVPNLVSQIAPTTTAMQSMNIGTVLADFPVRASPLAPEVTVSGTYGIRTSQRYIGRLVAPASATFSGSFTNVDRPAGVTFDPSTYTFTGVPIVPMLQGSFGGTLGEIRTPLIDGIEPPPSAGGLTQSDVLTIIDNAAANARLTKAAIRLPIGTSVVLHITVVDARGNILGIYRMGDATNFSSDIAVQKARTAAFFSTDGSTGLPACAISARAIGFLAQPFFPPGISTGPPGPFVRLRDLVNRGKITEEFPPSLTLINPPPRPPSDGTTDENFLVAGLQSFDDFAGAAPEPQLFNIRNVVQNGSGIPVFADRPDVNWVSPGLQSGLMTFPGGLPLYKNGLLVGAVGASGDGVDEDDQACFAGTAGFTPPFGITCDNATEDTLIAVFQAKINTLVAAIAAHPDPNIRDVYGPCLVNEQARINAALAVGFEGVTIPYAKFPRNPSDF